MALLDDLKQEAERIRREGVSNKSKEDIQKEFYEQQINPKLKHTYAYLNDLREQLNIIKPEILIRYDIPGVGPIDTIVKDYIIQIDSINQITQVGFRCIAAAAEIQRVTIRDGNTADELRNLFNRIKQPFGERPVRGFSGTTVGIRFEFMLNVPISVLFIADTPNRFIQMISTNLEGFRTWQHQIKPAKIDDAWLDRLGLYLLKRGPDPSALTLSETEREKIRRHLHSTQDKFID